MHVYSAPEVLSNFDHSVNFQSNILSGRTSNSMNSDPMNTSVSSQESDDVPGGTTLYIHRAKYSQKKFLPIGKKGFVHLVWDSLYESIIVNPDSTLPVFVPLPIGRSESNSQFILAVNPLKSLHVRDTRVKIAIKGYYNYFTEGERSEEFYFFKLSRPPYTSDDVSRSRKRMRLVWYDVECNPFQVPVQTPLDN